METKLKMIYWKGEKFWVGKLLEHPEIMTQGETLEELEDNMKDAFTDVADGTFYVVTKINWNVHSGIQGGSIMKSVTLSRGSKAEVTLSP